MITIKQMKKMKMTPCEDFDSITHPRYEDAGCFGCSFLEMWTDGFYNCLHEKKHNVIKRGELVVNNGN